MRRHYRGFAALLLIGMLISSCSLGDTPESAIPATALPSADLPTEAPTNADGALATAGEIVKLSFGAQSFERAIYEPLIDTFNQQNPDVQVQFVSLDEIMRSEMDQTFDFDRQLRRMVGAADTLSSFYLAPEAISKGYFYDMQPLIDADPSFARDDFYPGMLEQYTRDGHIYAIPLFSRIALLSYNKDIWANRGVAEPPPDWSMRDLLAAAEQLASKRGDTIEIYGLVDWSAEQTALFSELDAAGIDLAAMQADDLRLDRPEFAAALQRVAKLAASGAIYVQPRGVDGVISSDAFQPIIDAQKAAIWQRGFTTPNTKPASNIGTLPYPAMGGPFSFGGGQSFVMSSGTQHPQQAWRWLSFLSTQVIKRPFAGDDTGSELPARKSVAEQSGYWKGLDDQTKAAVEAILARPFEPLPAASPAAQLFEPLSQALNAVIAGEKTPEQALRDAQSRLEQLRAEIQLTPQPTTDASPIVVATPPPVAVAAPDAVTVTFGTFEYQAEQFRRLAETFNQNNPQTFVQIKPIDTSGESFSFAGAAAASDCFTWWSAPGTGELTATLDLQPLIDADPAFQRDDYPPALLVPFQQGSRLYGLPYAVTFRVLAYNKEAFDDAGLAYPTADWTMDDLLQAARKLTSGSEAQRRYGYATDSPQTEDLRFILAQFGAEPTPGSGDAQRPNFTDAKVAEAIRYYLDLLRDTSPHKEFRGYKRNEMFGGELFELMREGRVGISFEFGNNFFFIGPGSQPQYTRVIAPPPLGTGPLPQENIRSSGLFVSAQTQQAQACWQWLTFLSNEPADLAAQGSFPARRSLAEADAFLQHADAGSAAVYTAYRAALDRAPASTAQTSSLYDSPIDLFWFFRAVDRALQGKDLDRELEQAQTLTEQYLACVRSGEREGVCAKQVDPTYEGWNIGETP
jgi:ABC-type glycerol-3-phosphate transport system substrate-binding protein